MTYSKELHDELRKEIANTSIFLKSGIDTDWVSVNERLPDDKGEYLCYLKPDIFTSFYGDSWDGNLAFRSVIAPTHWQPLPTPPEVQS